jgi:glycosyltransferase involved in cell wall biosynthesis
MIKMKRKLSLFLPYLGGGGAQRVILNLANRFAEEGIDVDIVLAEKRGDYIEEVSEDVDIIGLGASRVLTSVFRLANYLRSENPDVLLSAIDHANTIATWAGRISMTSTRIAISVQNTMRKKYDVNSWNAKVSVKHKIMPKIMKASFRWTDEIIAVSTEVAEDLERMIGIDTDRIEVIYNPGVSDKLIEDSDEAVDHPWFGPSEPPVILGVGRLNEQKDFGTLIRAFRRVQDTRPVRLVILGEGQRRSDLESLVEETGLEDCVSLPGFVNNPYKYMTNSDLFVLSSAWEGLPLVLVEAMACGTPVVSTDCPGGANEVLEDGKWGDLVPVGNPERLADAIIASLDTSDTDGLRDRAMDFHIDRIAEQYLDVILSS